MYKNQQQQLEISNQQKKKLPPSPQTAHEEMEDTIDLETILNDKNKTMAIRKAVQPQKHLRNNKLAIHNQIDSHQSKAEKTSAMKP